MAWELLANVVLIGHVAFVAFVVLGLPAICVGVMRDWSWVFDPRFRYAHLGAIAVVVVQSWLGVECPLTTLESSLRSRAGEAGYAVSFVQDWLWRLLFYEASTATFVFVYTAFGAAVALAWWLAPPRASRHGLD